MNELKFNSNNIWEWSLNNKKDLKKITKDNCTLLFDQLKENFDQSKSMSPESIDKILKRIRNQIKVLDKDHLIYLKFLSVTGLQVKDDSHPACEALLSYQLTDQEEYLKLIPTLIESNKQRLTALDKFKILNSACEMELKEVIDVLLKNNIVTKAAVIDSCIDYNSHEMLEAFIDQITPDELQESFALYKAVNQHSIELVKIILNKTESIEIKEMGNIFHIIDDPELMKFVLKKIKENDQEGRKLSEFLNCKDPSGNTPLHKACERGNALVVDLLLKEILTINNKEPSTINLDSKNINEQTPLHLACKYDGFDVVKLLLKNEASINISDNFGFTPLYYAFEIASNTNEFEISDLIFEKLMENFNKDLEYPNLPNNISLLHYACNFSDVDKRFQFVKKLVEAGCNLHGRDNIEGITPIFVSLAHEDLEIVKYLHQNGALLTVSDSSGRMLIEDAIKYKNSDFIHYFIENVAIDVSNKENILAFAYIFLYQKENEKLNELLKDFSKNGKSIDIDELKTTLLIKACFTNNLEAVNVIFEGFKISSNNLFTKIPFEYVDDPQIIQALIEHGANPWAYEGNLLGNADVPFPAVTEALSAILKSQSGENIAINLSETSNILAIKQALRSNIYKVIENSENPLKVAFFFQDKNALALIKGMISEADFAKYQDSLLEEFGENAENFVFEIDQAHFEKGLTVETPLPPAPQGVEFGELSEMFKEINFTEPEKPGYKDPLFITNEGKSRSPADLQKAIDWLIKRTKERLTKDEKGNPLAGIPKDAERHYDLWTLYLLHITNETKKLEPNDKANHLIEVAKWGEFCNGKITSAAYEARALLGLINTGDEGVEPEICRDLKNFQLGYFEKAAKNSSFGYSLETHYYNQLRHLLQDKLHLPEKEAYHDEDPYAEYMKLNVSTEKIYENFLGFYYTPKEVIDFMHSTWEDRLDNDLIKKEEFLDYLRDNPDPSFDKENYEKKLKLIQSEKPRAEILQEFKETFGYALATGDISPLDALKEARKLDYKRNYKQPSLEEWKSDFYNPLFKQIEAMLSEKVEDEEIYRFLEEKGLKFKEKEKTPLDTLKEHRRLEHFYSEVEESDYRPEFYEKIIAELEGKTREEQIKLLKENNIPIKNDTELKSILDASRGMDYVDSVLKYKKMRDEKGNIVKNEKGFIRAKAILDRHAVRYLAKKMHIIEEVGL